MPYFDHASNFGINNGQFTDIEIHGNVYVGQHSEPDQGLVEKDASLNRYSAERGTLSIPRFSKSLLLRDLPECPEVGRIGAGSCAFDLLVRLGLFPGQPSETFAEYDTAVPLGAVVSRGNCYCGRISRHGFIYLVSKYFQTASMADVSGGGTCIVISTSIGRFKCYEIGDRVFIHFDIGTRSSHVELVNEQDLDEICLAAQGQYLRIDDNLIEKWIVPGEKSLECLSVLSFFGTPNAIMYMTKDTMARWVRLKDFSHALVEAVLSMVDELTEPSTFVEELRNISIDPVHLANFQDQRTSPNKLALCVAFCRAIPKKHILQVSYEHIHSYSVTNISGLTTAHEHYRGQPVNAVKLLSTSQERFLHILHEFQSTAASSAFVHSHPIRDELRKLLQPNKANNVALLVYQGYLGSIAMWNCARILSRAREAPEEWIRFISADDDELFIG